MQPLLSQVAPRAGPVLDSPPSSSMQSLSVSRMRHLAFACVAYVLTFVVLWAAKASLHTFAIVGCGIGILSCLVIFLSAWTEPSRVQHPMSLLLFKTAMDFLIAVRFVWTPLIEDFQSNDDCRYPSALLTFCELASEGWMFCIALDLWLSLSSPFVSYKHYALRVYHPLVWCVATVGAITVIREQSAYGMFLSRWCWWKQQSTNKFHLQTIAWIVFYVPMGLMVSGSFLLGVASFYHLRHGLGQTFLQRARVVTVNSFCLALSFLQWMCYVVLYAVQELKLSGEDFASVLLFLLASCGFVDVIAWVVASMFCENEQASKEAPQANEALQTELTTCITEGILLGFAQSHRYEHVNPQEPIAVPMKSRPSYQVSLKHIWKYRFNLSSLKAELDQSTVQQTDSQMMFFEFCPNSFHKVRTVFGVTPGVVKYEMSNTLKKRFTAGGASGAIFFYSQNNRFIVKSTSKTEALFWTKRCAGAPNKTNAQVYAEYMESHPNTLLTRIYGVFVLKAYRTSFYMLMMENIFRLAHTIPIHETYDLKGSWVARSAEPPLRGALITCKHCNRKFKYKGTAARVNIHDACEGGTHHEPKLVGKDNNLRHRIRVRDPVGLIRQLDQDTELLCEMFNNMDYSLLVGIHMQDHPTVVQPGRLDAEGFVSPVVRGPAIYFLGIVDILQQWSWTKRLELMCKSMLLPFNSNGISAQPPQRYRQRFIRAMRGYIHGATNIPMPGEQAVEFRHVLEEEDASV